MIVYHNHLCYLSVIIISKWGLDNNMFAQRIRKFPYFVTTTRIWKEKFHQIHETRRVMQREREREREVMKK